MTHPTSAGASAHRGAERGETERGRRRWKRPGRGWRLGIGLAGAMAVVMGPVLPAAAVSGSSDSSRPFLDRLNQQAEVASTVPANGDLNPYGVAVVTRTIGRLVAGDVLVSNFNAKSNLQGTGSTIVEIAPSGQRAVFAHLRAKTLPGACPGGVGLTTALGILDDGYVVVGSLPTNAGVLEPGASGCLIVINPAGMPSFTVSGGAINGPWDLTIRRDDGHDQLFVTNVLNGTVAAGGATVRGGTIVRLTFDLGGTVPSVTESTVIASGLAERTDPAALVVGPTGVSINGDGTLYVANSAANDIRAVRDAGDRHTSAGMGSHVSAGGELNDPLGMALAPNGDILTANGTDGNIVETTPDGMQVAEKLVDANPQPGPRPGNGALFGLAVAPGTGLYFVDDDNNDLNLLSR